MNIDAARAVLADSSEWRKSRHSSDNGCVEVNHSVPGYIGMRDSKLGADSPVLVFEPHEIRAFLLGAKDCEFDYLLS